KLYTTATAYISNNIANSYKPISYDHLLIHCCFTSRVWGEVLGRRQLLLPSNSGCHSLLQWWGLLRQSWPPNERLGTDSPFGLVCWSVWKERNSCCFNGENPSLPRVLLAVRDTAELWIQGGARKLGELGLV
ncbi:hypothetical protein BS78_04G277800, partial [Paspalum vaginatum]